MMSVRIGRHLIGPGRRPFIIAEAGINHEGSFRKAVLLADAARRAGADCVKFQTHITEKEMVSTPLKPPNAPDRIWDIIKRCELSAAEERRLKRHCDRTGILFLSTPFSREAADRLQALGVPAFKIGSGECNNLPLIAHIARFRKPVILSTGMNDLRSVAKAVRVVKQYACPLVLLQCTSMYPTPYHAVRLDALKELRLRFRVPVGLSDHSLGIYTALGAVALGAAVIEKHLTVSRRWPGPDIPISITPAELAELVHGSRAIHEARGGAKTVLPGERGVIAFAYASVVTLRRINAGERFTLENVWVKRPGTGELRAADLSRVLASRARRSIEADTFVRRRDCRKL